MLHRINSSNHSSNRSNRSISNLYSPENSTKITCFTCGELGHKSLNCRKYSLENGFGDRKLLIIKDPKILGYLKETNLTVLQEQSKKTYKKGMWLRPAASSDEDEGEQQRPAMRTPAATSERRRAANDKPVDPTGKQETTAMQGPTLTDEPLYHFPSFLRRRISHQEQCTARTTTPQLRSSKQCRENDAAPNGQHPPTSASSLLRPSHSSKFWESTCATISKPVKDASELPKWNYDGSSTGQAP
ncbi:hypothetical protein H5410_047910 [Solanum commersonii]|uniref:CCHC-type domain-containing protein n=1 Tax=Solanum commersonii TaxID=4109 RepID=A0A9J5XJL8_SOLCO|nr:hypothetical protein H5410_047910 [Solanum commersonii]